MKETTKAWLYLRVSTDDKDQKPERQRDLLVEWCEKNNVQIAGETVDEGTSATKTNPFERRAFLDALRGAQGAGAAILVEKQDRFTRQGSEEYGWAKVEMRRQEPPVPLWVALKGSIEDQDREVVGAIVDTIEAETAKKWAKDHGQRVRSGMATAQKNGVRFGRKPKELTPEELNLARELYERKPKVGVRKIAARINRERGLLERADVTKAIRSEGVSRTLVWKYLTGEKEVSA